MAWLDVIPGKWVAALVLALMVIFSIIPMYNGATREDDNMDYNLWQRTGQVVLDGGEIYPQDGEEFPFMYPPPCAVMLAPVSWLPELGFVFMLVMMNSLAWAACIFLSVFLVAGRWIVPHPGLYLWPSVAVIPLVHNTYLLGQPALVLLALVLGCFAMLRTGRPFTAGALLAVAVAIKAYPLIAAGYFVYRFQWRALAGLVVALLVLFFVFPLMFRTPAQVVEDATVWTKGMVFKYEEKGMAQRPERSYSFRNQSVQAVVHRLTRPVHAGTSGSKTRWEVNVINLTFAQANILLAVVAAGLVVFYVATTFGVPKVRLAEALETGMVTMLPVLLAPLSFQYSYVWLIYPISVMLYLGLTSAPATVLRRASAVTIGATVGLLLFSIPFTQPAAAYGNIFFAGLAVYLGCGIILRAGWWRKSPDQSGASGLV